MNLADEKQWIARTVATLRATCEMPENPLQNLASLYGTGTIKLDAKNQVVRAGGVKYTVKDGIIYDARQLLADVRRMVKTAKEAKAAKAAQDTAKAAQDADKAKGDAKDAREKPAPPPGH